MCPTLRAALGPALITALLVGLVVPAAAQIDGPHAEVSLLGGYLWPGSGLDMESAPMFSLRGGLYPSARLGLEVVADIAPSDRSTNRSLKYDYSFLGTRAVVNLSPMELVAPYVFGGLGVTVLSLDYETRPSQSEPGLTAHLGLGLRAYLSRALALRAEVRGLFPAYDEFGTQNLHAGLGVSMSFGRDSDKDLDGITDSIDRCPQTPPGSEVDWRGCPYDDDVDGVPNGLDICPDTPMGSRVDSKGCEIPVPTLDRNRR